MSEWIDYKKEKPKIEKYYLVKRIYYDTGETFYEVDRFEHQDEYESVYLKEYKQNVRIRMKSKGLGFKGDFINNNTFVTKWMEIPE